MHVSHEGAGMAKGTTTAKGLVHSSFANVFGPQSIHDQLAQTTFEAALASGVFVGQLRTRLGIPGNEMKDPEEAAQQLFDLIAKIKR